MGRRVRVLEVVEAIKRLKHRYANACDRGYDSDTLASLFAEDAVWDGGLFGCHEGREAIRATGSWYLFQTCTFAAGNTPVWGAARYDEEYVREADGWKFQRLHLISSFWTPYDEGWVKRTFVQEA